MPGGQRMKSRKSTGTSSPIPTAGRSREGGRRTITSNTQPSTCTNWKPRKDSGLDQLSLDEEHHDANRTSLCSSDGLRCHALALGDGPIRAALRVPRDGALREDRATVHGRNALVAQPVPRAPRRVGGHRRAVSGSSPIARLRPRLRPAGGTIHVAGAGAIRRCRGCRDGAGRARSAEAVRRRGTERPDAALCVLQLPPRQRRGALPRAPARGGGD